MKAGLAMTYALEARLGGQDSGEKNGRRSQHDAALDRFQHSAFAKELLGPDLHRLYSMVKRHELDEFNGFVTAQEMALYLPAL